MVAYREPDGLERTKMVLSLLKHEVRVEIARHRKMKFMLVFFGTIFLCLVAGETLFATMMFSIIQIEILGSVFSGAAFALLVPTVIAAAHVKLHHEGDHFTRWWMKKLSSIGILIFALGVSLMIGFSAWQASQDALSTVSSGPSGSLGGESVGGEADESSGLATWLGIIPNGLLFLGLAFGMIITISFASFCLGRVLEAFNVLTQAPTIGKEILERIDAISADIALLRKLRDEHEVARRKLPFDIKAKFAREAANASWQVVQAKLMAARRAFDPMAGNDPLGMIARDPAVHSIPSGINSEEEFAQHMAEQMDVMRMHNLLRVLTGIPEKGKDSL